MQKSKKNAQSRKIEEENAQCKIKSKKNMPSAAFSTASPICTAPGLKLGVRFEKKGLKI